MFSSSRIRDRCASELPGMRITFSSFIRCFEKSGRTGKMAMLSRRKTYAGGIKHPDDATEPATLDPLGSIAPLFRARPEIQDVCRFALQWEVVHEAEPAGVCPPATCRTIRSRPDGVRRAFLWMSSGPLLRKLKPRQLQLPRS